MKTAVDEVADLCSELIRIDTSNPTSNERKAAEYVAEKLSDVGIDSQIFESDPGRASIVARLEGQDRSRPPLLIHGHLDVVPADPDDWQVHPFSGEEKDGCIWGRGAVDMKDMDAMTLSVIREYAATGAKPARDLVLAFLADEEAGGGKGARFLVDNHAELFEGCTEAISEVGGFCWTVGGVRIYPIEAAEKGMSWMRITAKGRAGHGSMVNDDNAVTALAEAVARIGRHKFPVRLTKTVEQFLHDVADALGVDFDPSDPESLIAKCGPMTRMVAATVRNTANPTMLEAGYKVNVIPGAAHAYIDGRFLPGYEDEFEQQINELIGPDVQKEQMHQDIAMETDFDGPLVDAMTAAIVAEDPEAKVVPYCISGGTDAKSFSRLGMRCFGFSPLWLPEDLDFQAMFHGVDERVPVDGLKFGVKVLRRFLDTC